ncbi:MAG: cupredoxin domain-containing protein [Candidatus Limnocylindrales bacterium]
MTDTPGREPTGREPESEQRLPVPRPPAEVAPVERFTSPPSTRSFELTPERAAQVVRQSSNARWVGFLAVVVVILFVALYWFYELGLPGGLSQPRLGLEGAEVAAQQVTSVERGYNVYEANCARCHGDKGQGGIGPVLNRQDKLFAHLSEDYLLNILTVGGRYACGDAASLMPLWSDQGNPPGPLNYRQIEELIAFLRAPSDQTYIVRDPELVDPMVDPLTGEIRTFKGWRDPNFKPEPAATPYPACWQDEFTSASPAPSGEASGAPSGEASGAPPADPSATVIDIAALNIAFDKTTLSAPADAAFVIKFDNQDASIQHNVEIKDAAGASVFKGEIFPGPGTRDYQVGALAAGSYPFVCTVHPNMLGTLTAE